MFLCFHQLTHNQQKSSVFEPMFDPVVQISYHKPCKNRKLHTIYVWTEGGWRLLLAEI